MIAPGLTAGVSTVRAAAESSSEQCTHLYTDDEARDVARRAEQVLPIGTERRKETVLKELGVEPARLCHRRVGRANLAYVESWKISTGFDIRWAAGTLDRTPLDRKDRKIFHVSVVPRGTPLYP
jgi:hypothetical protein